MEGNTETTARSQTALIARIAWFATFVLPLVLAVLLLGARSAQATPSVLGFTPLSFEEEFEFEGEEEEGDFEPEACEVAEEDFEEGELSEAAVEASCDETTDEGRKKAGGSGSVAPEECILRSAHAQASLFSHDHKLKLTLGYTSYEPVSAKIEVGKGASHIATLHRHLGRSGVIRLVKSQHSDSIPRRLVLHIELPSVKRDGCPSRRLVLFPR